MNILEVRAEGIFGRRRELRPDGRVVVITGPNEAGKTSLLRLPELALTPKTRGDLPLIGVASEPWRVELALAGGPRIVRSGACKGAGLEINGAAGKLADQLAKLSETIGPASSWSIADLQAMTPGKRLEWLQEEILEAGGQDLHAEVEPYGEALTAIMVEGFEVPGSVSVSDLADLLALLAEADKEAASNARRLLQACKQDEADVATEQLPSGTVASWREKIADLDRQASGVQMELGKIEGAQRSRESLGRQITVAQAKASAAPGNASAIRSKGLSAIADLKEGVGKATKAHEDIGAARAALEGRTSAAEKAKSEARFHEHACKMEAGRLWDALESIGEHGVCPTCDRLATDEVRAALRTQHERAVAAIKAAEEAHGEARIRVLGLDEERDQLRLNALASRKRVDEARSRLSDAQTRFDQKLADITRAHEAAEEASRDLERLHAEMADLPDTSASEALREQLAGIKVERAEATASADKLSDAASLLAQHEDRRRALGEAQDARQAARDLIAALGPRGLLGRAVAAAFAPIVEPASDFLEAITGARLWIETEGGFRWGYSRGDGIEARVPIETASESHQVAAFLALGIAIRSRLDGWRFVAIDGLEVMEPGRRTALVEQLALAIGADLLDDVWVAAVADGWEPPDGLVHHVRLEGSNE